MDERLASDRVEEGTLPPSTSTLLFTKDACSRARSDGGREDMGFLLNASKALFNLVLEPGHKEGPLFLVHTLRK